MVDGIRPFAERYGLPAARGAEPYRSHGSVTVANGHVALDLSLERHEPVRDLTAPWVDDERLFGGEVQ